MEENFFSPDWRLTEGLARASVVAGVFSLVFWVIPFLGTLVGFAGILTGVLGRKSTRQDLARAGISLGIIGVFLSGVFLVIVLYLVVWGDIDH